MRGIQRLLQGKNLFIKSFWLSFPSLFFVLLLWQYLWIYPLKDNPLLNFLDTKYSDGIFLAATLLYVLIAWYSGRLLVYGKHALSSSLYRHFKKQEHRSGVLRKNAAFYLQLIFSLPRVCAFLIFSIVWIYLLVLIPLKEQDPFIGRSYPMAYILFAGTIFLYIILYRVGLAIRQGIIERSQGNYITDEEQRRRKNIILISYLLLIFLLIISNTIIKNSWLLIFSLILLQVLFPFIIIIRRAYSDLKHTWYDHWVNSIKRKSHETVLL